MGFLIVATLFALDLYAHDGSKHPTEPAGIKWRIVWGLSLFTLAYAYSWLRASKRSLSKPSRPTLRLCLFGVAILVLSIALFPPIDTLSESLASIHMVQHTLIMMLAAPLMALAAPDYFWVFSLPKTGKRKVKRTYRFLMAISKFRRPIALWCLYAVTLYIWHLPKFYEAALKAPFIHDMQHLAFFGSSFLFWRVVLYPFGKTLNSGVAILYLFVSMLHAMALGVLMALSPVPWYRPYFATAPNYGLTPLMDQQIAGFIMWMPAGISFLLVALIGFRKSLKVVMAKN